ncbi:hypothetical protein BDQ17DRAFT_1427948 [Cyathus striatus]|nr:hypothetical protein BDQ17DRAFT_1427948 [Cyathus striatus]
MVAEETPMKCMIENKGLPKLRKLMVDCERVVGETRSYMNPWPFTLFTAAVALDTLSLYQVKFPGIKDFPWSNMRELVLRRCNIDCEDIFYSALCAMPLLEKLVWDSNWITISSGAPTILLPSLHMLNMEKTIFNMGEEDCLPMICVPCLNNISIHVDITELHSLLTIIRMSRCAIKCLELYMNSSYFILEITKELRDVEELIICLEPNHFDCFLTKLTCRPEDSSDKELLLPSLQRLVLDFWSDVDSSTTIPLLMDLMHSRSSISSTSDHRKNASLLYIKLVGNTEEMKYRSLMNQMQNLGKELGIEVDIDF